MQNETQWTPWLRTLAGIRADGYRFRVDASHPGNSGTDVAALVSPKGGVTFGPWSGTEVYVNGGFGFHSNDARGATITVDPATGVPADRVTPLVRAKGMEVGAADGCRAAPPDNADDAVVEPGMRLPAGSSSVKRDLDTDRSPSNVSQGRGA